jgi:hypothetical protein
MSTSETRFPNGSSQSISKRRSTRTNPILNAFEMYNDGIIPTMVDAAVVAEMKVSDLWEAARLQKLLTDV